MSGNAKPANSLLLAGQELRHPLRGCAYDILGFILDTWPHER